MENLNEPIRAMVKCAWETAMRRREIFELRTEQVKLNENPPHIYILHGMSKNDEARRVPLWEPLLSEIKSRLDGEWVYPNPETGKPYISIKRHWATALKNADIKDFRFHDLRHCAITNMRRKGISERVIMSITGHLSLQMHYRYSNVNAEDLTEAIKIMKKKTKK